ncbi:hypothetical protein AAKU55_001064 [Oxalobacteraceae bacterium GrIS 1.11]
MTKLSIASKLLALGFCAAFFYAVWLYPFQNTWLGPILIGYFGLLCWHPRIWLFALPALLPVLDLAPWTGWFFLEELDLLLLMTAACAYWQLSAATGQARVPGYASACIGLLTVAYLIAGYRGLRPLPLFDANAFTSYLSPYNSLRVGKAWCWALVLLPVLTRAAGAQLAGLHRYFVPGMLSGLCLVSGADAWERMVFPGLLNFSSDYRISAPFSGMHTGGAALDGYLALSLPFVASWLLTLHSRTKTAAALALLALGAYAGLSTFSRGLFVGLACSSALITLFLLRRIIDKPDRSRLMLGFLLVALCAYALTGMFFASGYRGLTAALTLLAAAFIVGGLAISPGLLLASLFCGVGIDLILAVLLASMPGEGLLKPPYLLFSTATLVFGGGAWQAWRQPANRGAASIALLAFAGMACNTFWIAQHWGGAPAHAPALLVILLALLPMVLNLTVRRRLWRLDRAAVIAVTAGAVLLMLSIPIGASYYAAERFSSVRKDLNSRVRHWSQVLNMMDGDHPTQIFGMGLGTFPATYFWRNPLRESPAAFSYVDEINNRYVRLFTPAYALGYGEVLRLLQRIPVRANTAYLLEIDIRRVSAQPVIQINICERLLLYPQNCVGVPLRLLPPDSHWHHYQVVFDSASLGAAAWPLRAPVQIELAAEGGNAVLDIDIDNVSVRAALGGEELIRNGTFSDSNNYWFFSSDHHHLPWHVKNLALNVYFELGWLGLASLLSLLSFVLGRLLLFAWHGKPDASVYLAALAGFLMVGLFDSLLDVPRIALLFFLVLFCSVLQPLHERPPS